METMVAGLLHMTFVCVHAKQYDTSTHQQFVKTLAYLSVKEFELAGIRLAKYVVTVFDAHWFYVLKSVVQSTLENFIGC